MSHSSNIRRALFASGLAGLSSVTTGVNASPQYATDGNALSSHVYREHVYDGPMRRSPALREHGSRSPRPAAREESAPPSRRLAHHEPEGEHGKNPTSLPRQEIVKYCWHSNNGCGSHVAGPPDTPASIHSGRSNAKPPSTDPVVNQAHASTPPANPSPAKLANICETGGTFVTIAFQPNATALSITAFLKEYDIVMVDGPTADGMYRIKISPETVPVDQFGQMIDSMRGRTTVVASIYS